MPKPYDIQPRHVEAIAQALADVHALLAASSFLAETTPSRAQLLGEVINRAFVMFLQKAHNNKTLSPEVGTYKASQAFAKRLEAAGYNRYGGTNSRQALAAALREALEALQDAENQE